MSIPPFPAKDLAKLVLGYLAEEQLMTAYDEFLQTSPYLDPHRNEYTRFYMTSLRTILAEHLAVKICVETCKPLSLRKRFQCTNLLEVVEFLIANVDLKKIHQTSEKSSADKQNVTITPKPVCELCQSLSQPSCVCKSRTTEIQKPITSLQGSVEATPLDELPGNYAARKKHVKPLEKSSTLPNSNVSSARQSFASHITPEEYLARCENSPVAKSSDSSLNSTVKAADPKASQNIEEFNNVLKSVVSRNRTLSSSEGTSSSRISNAGTFQDFSSGVTGGGNHNATYNVPDSSTSENLNVRAATRRDVYNDNVKGPPHQLMLQVSQVNDTIAITSTKAPKLPKLLPKTQEKKIKVISDIKVDSQINRKLIPVNATSTPVMNMQTIMINGIQAYKHTPNTHNFTKDEIMAMPTLIVVPAAGTPDVPTSIHVNPLRHITPNATEIPEANIAANNSPNVLGPLVIDVPSHTEASSKPAGGLPDLSDAAPVSDLIKTVDAKTNNGTTASVPKDNVIASENNTPQVLPPMRKSSSTPRRTSHVRVLDFTTPRRILHETINEVPVPPSETPLEIVESGSHNVIRAESISNEPENQIIPSDLIEVTQEERANDTSSAKENELVIKPVKLSKKHDWDADLRALVANESFPEVSHRKPKTKTSKKKKSVEKAPPPKETASKKTRKQSPRVKKNNKEEPEMDPPPDVNKSTDCIKPNIKIICGDKSTESKESKADTSGSKNKSNEKVEEHIETPETERLSLQNVIGAKLNISDFLETPYKQALYDIQMETPKFLGPDLPDIPLSTVKITDIPTPRFLNTPKASMATPSSYSSRPTDYSSGGSYYKPDDQDYLPIPELLTCTVISSSKVNVSHEKLGEKDSDDKKSRPVRQCAKNVSYYKSTGAVKNKTLDDNVDANSTCSDSANSSVEFRSKKDTTVTKTPRARAQTSKSESKKKVNSCKKKKSPKDSVVKDKSKSFMKIKPKFKKDTPAKSRKQMMLSPYSKGSPVFQPRKRTTSKDKKLANTAALVVPAITKSRRKSSTPRKLQCAKPFNAETCSHDAADNVSSTKANSNIGSTNNSHDSDADQIKLRWSDEGSQDAKSKDSPVKSVENDSDDLSKIKQFIVSTGETMSDRLGDGTLQRDLMKRGFDSETAKIIERDLLDDAPMRSESSKTRTLPISVEIVENKKDDSAEKTEPSISKTKDLQIEEYESDDDEIEFSVFESNEESSNYFVFEHDDTKEVAPKPPTKLKDNFTMEICVEDVTVRLKATPFSLVVDQDSLTVDEIDYTYKETERAVESISGMDKLYTPLKDSYKSKCFEIFDSTLTSIDTPLKEPSPARNADVSVTELVLQGDSQPKDKSETNTRKRARSSSNESANSTKRNKPDADLLLKAANIQNIDIETVLTKLHGH